MHKSIRFKLFLAFIITTLLVVAGMYAFMRWSLERGFSEFIETRQKDKIESLIDRLSESYAETSSWKAISNDKRQWVQALHPDNRHHRHSPKWVDRAMRGSLDNWPPADFEEDKKRRFKPLELRVMLLDADKSIIIGRQQDLSQLSLYPISYQQQTVGYLGLLPGKPVKQLSDLRFMEQQANSFIWITLLMVVLSAGLALLIAYIFGRPVKRIIAATKNLGKGDYSMRLPVDSSDELGQLAEDFNEMAKALQQSEQSRQRWIADVSHELRTPLAVLRGELEALQDGIRPMTKEAINSLFSDVMRLHRLTDDLYQLALSDQGALTYRKSKVNPITLLSQSIAGLKSESDKKQLEVKLIDKVGSVKLYADPDRLSQLFLNLLKNSIQYTNKGGQVTILLSKQAGQLLIDITDSAPAVPEQDLNKLFDRFYRVESSRNRNYGGAGLGLAICNNIVSAHNGIISAQASDLGGLTIHIELPITS